MASADVCRRFLGQRFPEISSLPVLHVFLFVHGRASGPPEFAQCLRLSVLAENDPVCVATVLTHRRAPFVFPLSSLSCPPGGTAAASVFSAHSFHMMVFTCSPFFPRRQPRADDAGALFVPLCFSGTKFARTAPPSSADTSRDPSLPPDFPLHHRNCFFFASKLTPASSLSPQR